MSRFNALTDLRTFPRNLEPDFTHYLCKQRKEMEIYERSRQRNHSHNVSASSSLVCANRSLVNGVMASTHGVPNQQSEINCANPIAFLPVPEPTQSQRHDLHLPT